jgi:peroxiredoxin
MRHFRLFPGLSAIVLMPFLLGATTPHEVSDLQGGSVDPFAQTARARVLLFVRTDCPVSQRYAPELKRLYNEFRDEGVAFWLVFPDPAETPASIKKVIDEYGFPGNPVLDPKHALVHRALAVTAPEAAVFDSHGSLDYHGRIDDLYVDIGKSRPRAQVHDLEDAIKAVLAGTPVREPQTTAVGCSLLDVQ